MTVGIIDSIDRIGHFVAADGRDFTLAVASLLPQIVLHVSPERIGDGVMHRCLGDCRLPHSDRERRRVRTCFHSLCRSSPDWRR